MHPKFAKRLARIAWEKKKAQGNDALNLWWKERFGHVSTEDFDQVYAALQAIAN
jgi:hypothetical protein